jgi:hypothetical protein
MCLHTTIYVSSCRIYEHAVKVGALQALLLEVRHTTYYVYTICVSSYYCIHTIYVSSYSYISGAAATPTAIYVSSYLNLYATN